MRAFSWNLTRHRECGSPLPCTSLRYREFYALFLSIVRLCECRVGLHTPNRGELFSLVEYLGWGAQELFQPPRPHEWGRTGQGPVGFPDFLWYVKPSFL